MGKGMTELQALKIAHDELSQLMPCEENEDIFEAIDVLQKMIQSRIKHQKMQQIKRSEKAYQLNPKPHNALGITSFDKTIQDEIYKAESEEIEE